MKGSQEIGAGFPTGHKDANVVASASVLELIMGQLRLIGSALDSFGPTEKAAAPGSLFLPLSVVLGLLPQNLVATVDSAEETSDPMIEVEVPNLTEQLLDGRVSVSVAALVRDVPAHRVAVEALVETTQRVEIPMPVVLEGLRRASGSSA